MCVYANDRGTPTSCCLTCACSCKPWVPSQKSVVSGHRRKDDDDDDGGCYDGNLNWAEKIIVRSALIDGIKGEKNVRRPLVHRLWRLLGVRHGAGGVYCDYGCYGAMGHRLRRAHQGVKRDGRSMRCWKRTVGNRRRSHHGSGGWRCRQWVERCGNSVSLVEGSSSWGT
jgi:hypothetical protein